MAQIRPFAGIHYVSPQASDLSGIIAPPYDVLDVAQRDALRARDPHNVVNIDLPHLPAKSAGPDEVYANANVTLQAWLRAGVLKRDARPALYPYVQSYEHAGRTFHRRGLITLVKLSPFGAGEVVPHEKTYKGPIEDRLKLMRATGVQLSPIFGLFSDPRNDVTAALFKDLGKPALSGTLDGVKNDLWSVIDATVENQVIDLMGTRPVYIADGHHRYTTALQYQSEIQAKHGGSLPPQHPANYCMFVLVAMQDDGLLILPTHRLVGGLKNFTLSAFASAISKHFSVKEEAVSPQDLQKVVAPRYVEAGPMFHLYDGKSRKVYSLELKTPDLLASYEPGQSVDWRKLDVAILQRYLFDEILQPLFAAGGEVIKGYTADASTIASQVDGEKYQLALVLRPTPLQALEALGKHGEVMPQKSTYFYPKLATGMMMYPLE